MRVWSIVLKKESTIYATLGIGDTFGEALGFAYQNSLTEKDIKNFSVQCYTYLDIEDYDENNKKIEKQEGLKQFNNLIKKL